MMILQGLEYYKRYIDIIYLSRLGMYHVVVDLVPLPTSIFHIAYIVARKCSTVDIPVNHNCIETVDGRLIISATHVLGQV
jgi:hypothetical protein